MKKNFKKRISVFAIATTMILISTALSFTFYSNDKMSFNYVSSSKNAIGTTTESEIKSFTTKTQAQMGDD